jgi:RND superfamily putative drug exporter
MSSAPAAAAPRGLARLAHFADRHRRAAIAGWGVLLVAIVALGTGAAGTFKEDFSTPGSESSRAAALLEQRFGDRSPDTIDVVWEARGDVRSPAARERVQRLLRDARRLSGIAGVLDPLRDPGLGAIAPGGHIAVASLQLRSSPAQVPTSTAVKLVALAKAASGDGLRVELAGDPISKTEEKQSNAELIGLLAATMILVLTFGSVVAAGLPIIAALFGLAISVTLIGLLAALTSVPDFATAIAAMIGLGVGIDYALLIVTRYRTALGAGADSAAALTETMTTAGRSVLIAGSTVVISLLGLLVIGLRPLQGLAIATSLTVLIMMAASVTLLPALLAVVGTRIDRLHIGPRRSTTPSGDGTRAARWSLTVQRRPLLFLGVGAVVLLALIAPIRGLRFGAPDAGNNPKGTQTRAAYRLVARGFGPGANGPLLIVAGLPAGPDRAAQDLRATLRETPGVASVSSPQLDAGGTTAVLAVTPTTSPQARQTSELVRRLRRDVLPAARARTGAHVLVGGTTAADVDQNAYVAKRMPWFVGTVILLSFLLLLIVFRSPLIAIKAAAMNLASIGAAFGVVSLFARGGALGGLVGIDSETPVPAFIPVIMFAILFGLSMDYEVFLLTRIREEYAKTADTASAVTAGLGATAGVITAAAAIMTVVFLAFVGDYDVFVKLAGLGLAAAVLIDATIVRLMLVPAVMQLLGDRNWWIPAWLDRLLPRLDVEPPVEIRDLGVMTATNDERTYDPV